LSRVVELPPAESLDFVLQVSTIINESRRFSPKLQCAGCEVFVSSGSGDRYNYLLFLMNFKIPNDLSNHGTASIENVIKLFLQKFSSFWYTSTNNLVMN